MASEQAVSLIQQACERLQVTEVNSDGLRVAVKGAVTWVGEKDWLQRDSGGSAGEAAVLGAGLVQYSCSPRCGSHGAGDGSFNQFPGPTRV